ncbi:MAG: DUF5615 family PIN-like protein [Planctomycetota bacterium]
MNRLFISLYLDEDVSALVAKLLQARGFVAVTTQEAGRLARGDEEQLEFACRHGHALLTHNRRHFEELAVSYSSAGRSHSGIIIAVRRRPHEIVGRLLAVLNQVTADEMTDQIYYV